MDELRKEMKAEGFLESRCPVCGSPAMESTQACCRVYGCRSCSKVFVVPHDQRAETLEEVRWCALEVRTEIVGSYGETGPEVEILHQ